MLESPWIFFTDAILRAPTIGSMLMCFAAALVGVVVFLRKQSLLGEAISHAAYPGVIVGVVGAGIFSLSDNAEVAITFLILCGAFLSALIGLWAINTLVHKLRVRSDAALCFVLSSFFGVGLTIASHVQFSFSSLYRQAQVYLFGQAATMTDVHIFVYGLLSIAVLMILIFFYKEIQVITFDRDYATSLGIQTGVINLIFYILIALAIVIGIRSVGVVLMSAMFIAPAAAARQYTNKLSAMLVLAGIFGLVSGYLGNYLSVEGTRNLSMVNPGMRLSLPTGPMIVCVATAICVVSLLFAPERGIVWRWLRVAVFRYRCLCENIMKSLWHFGPGREVSLSEIKRYQTINTLYLRFILYRLARSGWVDKTGPSHYRLSTEGALWAVKIVRLHRLWEVYLADYLGVGAERVHRNAEEMEHIITPELERELTLLLKDPKRDPHHQPIPPLEG